MENLELYNKIRQVPENAQKEIKGGRLKGMTDINPQWRIQTLTEQFGVCGFGWKFDIVKLWLEFGNNNEIVANAEIKLYIKVGGEWSEGISGIGGSKLSTMEKDGVYVSDEAYKMAVTDAISVACKYLGMGADIYWQQNRTKYQSNNDSQPMQKTEPNGIGGDYIFRSGKYAGKKISEVPDDYLDWYLNNESTATAVKTIQDNIKLFRNGIEEKEVFTGDDLPF